MAIAAVTLSMGMTSCGDDDDDIDINVIKLPTKLTHHLDLNEDGTPEVQTFEYDSQNRIIKFTTDDIGLEEYTFTYEGNSGNPTKIISNDGVTYTFSYEGSKVIYTEDYGDDEKYEGTMEINSKGYPVKDDIGSMYPTSYEYDAKGNLIKEIHKGSEKTYSAKYTYDDKKGLMSQVKTSPFVFFILGDLEYFTYNTINNVITLKNYIDDEEDGSWTISYDYDSDEYITKGYSGNKLGLSVEYKVIKK